VVGRVMLVVMGWLVVVVVVMVMVREHVQRHTP